MCAETRIRDEPVLARIQREARVMLDSLSPAEWAYLLAFSASAAVIGTAYSKVAGVRQLGRSISSGARRAADEIQERGLSGAAVRIPGDFLTATSIQRARANALFRRLSLLGVADRRALVLDVIVAGAVAYLVAGGPDVEGGLPDLDLLLGVGHHRNPFSHTILIALSVEASLRFFAAALSQLHGRLPEDHDDFWDRALSTYSHTYEAGIVGVWLGTATHLLKDAGPPWAGVKPMVGLPVTLTVAGHKALLAGNSLAAAALGGLTFLGRKQYTRAQA